MVEEKNEETIENPEEEETSETTEEKPQEEKQEISEKPEKTSEELEETNKRLYARMKKAEEEAKSAKEELEKLKREKPSETPSDIFGLAKTVSALRDYSPQELGDIEMIAKAKGLPPEEAAKTEEAKLLIAARRAKVAKEQKVPEPSSRTIKVENKEIKDMSREEIQKNYPQLVEKILGQRKK